ncbi:tRNA (cytosine-5-)-methyltransferase [Modicella reniformis]|uniref:tRNA (Cytosine-5-)-methyltransferase n=1 Tax=Modicella reniformis TaxID=1440133 RepID=A0A9P6M8D7_9FUNG|nr:tRNA (cytosine-5-)-methyltransferase [Modicella reniformis]
MGPSSAAAPIAGITLINPSSAKADESSNAGGLIHPNYHRDVEIMLYLGDILDHVLTMLQSLWSYEKILDRSHSNYLAQISLEINQLSNKTNEVVGTLTFFASLIVPMTFLSGLWGMNVHVPGQPGQEDMTDTHHFRVLEFYSGIGGMHYALNESGHQGQVLKAFDINTTANEVYSHNHGKKQLAQYTRTGNQEGSKDTRAKSFLYLMDILPKMTHPPNYILLENVKGFEESDSRDLLVGALSRCGYEFQEMLITPLQFGIPNSRMRYYCLARKTDMVGSFVHNVTGTLIGYIPSLDTQGGEDSQGSDKEKDFVDTRKHGELSGLSAPLATKRRRTSLLSSVKTKDSQGNNSALTGTPDEDAILADPVLALKVETLEKYIEFTDIDDERMKRYMIPDKTLLKYGRLFDIVKKTTRRSCCFTKGKRTVVVRTRKTKLYL